MFSSSNELITNRHSQVSEECIGHSFKVTCMHNPILIGLLMPFLHILFKCLREISLE